MSRSDQKAVIAALCTISAGAATESGHSILGILMATMALLYVAQFLLIFIFGWVYRDE